MSEQNTGREDLLTWISLVHGERGAPFFEQKAFLERTYDSMSLLVHYNKGNALIQKSVQACPYVIPRIFTLLSILYGAYTHEPTKISLLKDFVGLLDTDLVEQEICITEYARNTKVPGFFPELSQIYETIQEVYCSGRYSLHVIPPTPYHAYVMYVSQYYSLLGANPSAEEVFKRLVIVDGKWQEIVSYVDKSNPAQLREIKNNGKLH